MSTSDDPTRAPAAFTFTRQGPPVERRVATYDRRHGASRGGRRASDHPHGRPSAETVAPAREPTP